jgi:hypothetical protein
MPRLPIVLVLSVLLVGSTCLISYAVTSEPDAPAGAPATSAPPPASAGEKRDTATSTGNADTHQADKKQEAKEQKAIKHVERAINQGKSGNAQGLRKHSETALKLAEQAEKRHPEAHVEESIKHLKMAVDEAQKGNAAEGTKHAQEALTSLQKK